MWGRGGVNHTVLTADSSLSFVSSCLPVRVLDRVMQRAVARRLAALERVADFLHAGQEAAWLRQVLREWREMNPPSLLTSSDDEAPGGVRESSGDDSDDADLPEVLR